MTNFKDKVILITGATSGQLGESHVVADAIEFLLSDKSSFVSGAAIPVQGGQHSRLY